MSGSDSLLPSARWQALGTSVEVVVTDAASLAPAGRLLEQQLAALDEACSRFRDDSEVRRLEATRSHTPQPVSPLLAELVDVALHAARITDGDVDPTLGTALVDLGYDRDLAALTSTSPRRDIRVVRRIPGWQSVVVDRGDPGRAGSTGTPTLTLPPGTLLDLGATAKAWAADTAAGAIASELGCGVLVSLGGDLASAGEGPSDGWRIRVHDRPGDEQHDSTATTVTLPSGSALATSSTNSRTWRVRGGLVHHIVDPRSLRPAAAVWRYVSVAARRCVDANTATTAAVVRGHRGPAFLQSAGLAARLVAADGSVRRIGAWPSEPTAPEAGAA